MMEHRTAEETMIQRKVLWEQFEQLEPDAQRQVEALIIRLAIKDFYKDRKTKPETPIEDEPFIGMWRDREDMSDSTDWVRQVRAEQWGT
jgi:hypothetical protein